MANGVGALPGVAVGLIFGASYGAYIDANINLKDRLENRGVNIVELGDQVLIVVPSSRLFMSESSVIRPEAFITLDLVTEYLNRYTKMLVKVAAYTDNSGSKRVDLCISEQQAQSVAKFFMLNGLDARLLYAAGYGGSRLITRNSGEGSDNNRIEITLEKLYV